MKKQNFLQRIFSRAKKKMSTFIPMATINFNSGVEDYLDTQNLNTYSKSLYLYIGVSMIRDSVSGIPLELYKIINAEGDTEEVTDSDVLTLLHRPNKSQTQKEFWKLAISYYILAGETFWYLERNNEKELPTSKVNLRPDYVEILFTADRSEIIGYTFQSANGRMLNLRPDQVLHIKNIDPNNPIRGMGIIRPASQRIVTEREASRHQSETFTNQGRPDVAIFTDSDLSDEALAEARANWAEIYGKNKGAQAAFFGEEVKSMTVIGNNSPKEMDFMNTLHFLRDDILAALHIPKAMVTSDDVNLANSKTARINYMKEAVLPVLDTFIDVINNKLLHDLVNDQFVTYTSPVNEDRELLMKEAVQLKKAGIITTNEARFLVDFEEREDGNDLAGDMVGGMFGLSFKQKNNQLRKLAKQFIRKRTVLNRKLQLTKAIGDLITDVSNPVKRQRNSVFHTADLKDKYIKAFNNNIDKKSELFLKTIDVYNSQFLGRIIKFMEDFGVQADKFFDVTTEIIEARKVFEPLMHSMYKRVGTETMETIANGFTEKAAESFYTPEEVIVMLNDRAMFFITSMLNTDFDEMRSIIADSMANGQGVEQIGRNLRQYFDDMSVSRAKTIARTETGRLVSQATNEAYRQSAVVTGKEWLTAEDFKVRGEHRINNRTIMPVGAAFPNGEHFPGEHTINCRCVIAPAI